MTDNKKNIHENGLILTLLALSSAALIWLFAPFLPALFLSLLICITTYSGFNKLTQTYSHHRAALVMVLGVTILLILPLSYVILVSGIEVTGLIRMLEDNFKISEITKNI